MKVVETVIVFAAAVGYSGNSSSRNSSILELIVAVGVFAESIRVPSNPSSLMIIVGISPFQIPL